MYTASNHNSCENYRFGENLGGSVHMAKKKNEKHKYYYQLVIKIAKNQCFSTIGCAFEEFGRRNAFFCCQLEGVFKNISKKTRESNIVFLVIFSRLSLFF